MKIPLNTGVDFVRQSINIALGREIDEDSIKPRFNLPVSQRYFFPRQDV